MGCTPYVRRHRSHTFPIGIASTSRGLDGWLPFCSALGTWSEMPLPWQFHTFCRCPAVDRRCSYGLMGSVAKTFHLPPLPP